MFGRFLHGDILLGTPRHSSTYRTAEFKSRFFFFNRSPGYIGLHACFTESMRTRKTFRFSYRLQTYCTIKWYSFNFTNSSPFRRHRGYYDEDTLHFGTFVCALSFKAIGGSRLSNGRV